MDYIYNFSTNRFGYAEIKIVDGQILINNQLILRKKTNDFIDLDKNKKTKRLRKYTEYFYDLEIDILDLMDNGIVDNTKLYEVPKKHFFVMGDNRDNSQDSRFLNRLGYVPVENLVGKAQFIFFSLENSRFFEIWKWPTSIRFERLMNKIK